MTDKEVIRRLNLMIEPGQDKNNEAVRAAIRAMRERKDIAGGMRTKAAGHELSPDEWYRENFCGG